MTSDVAVPTPEPAPGDPHTSGPSAASVTTAVPPRCPTRTRLYHAETLVAEGFPAEEISEHLAADADAVVWLDLFDPDTADLSILTQEFGLHPLAVEDAVVEHQRPKLDRYPSHLFLNVYAVLFDRSDATLTRSEMSAFITPRAFITVRKAEFDIDTVIARWDANPELAHVGVGFLAHGWLDAVVDGHYRAGQDIDDAADELEDALFDPSPSVDLRRRGFELRKSLGQLRRVTAPMREVLGRLIREDTHVPLVQDEISPYFHDVFDHVLGAAENIDSTRDLIDSILETNLNEQSNDLNEITKKLASWAAIIAVPTAITGWYGQNVPYPGFNQAWGFVTSTVVIIVLAGAVYLALRRRGWL
jgi:magnesium transporter